MFLLFAASFASWSAISFPRCHARSKFSFPSFLSWPPSIAHTLSYETERYIVLNGFCSWVCGGCIECSRGRGGFKCGEGVFPENHAQRAIEILQLSYFLVSLIFWLFLTSMRFGITLSPVNVCTHFETSV